MTVGSYSFGDTTKDPISVSKTWSGQDDPLLKKAENNYEMSMYRQIQSKSNYCYRNGTYIAGPAQYLRGAMTLRSTWTANDELILQGRLQTAISADFDAGVFGATLHEGLVTIKNSASAVLGSLNSLRKGDVVGAIRALGRVPGQAKSNRIKQQVKAGDISGAWLSLQYGWLPLISDCFEAGVALERAINRRSLTFRVNYKKVLPVINCALSPTRDNIPWSEVHRVSLKATLNEDVSVPRALGLTDPFKIAWEITPWSFVVDWFIPIGDFLAAASYFRGLNITWVRTEFLKGSGEYLGPIDPNAATIFVSGGWKGTSVRLSRTKGTGITVKSPSFKSVSKALSLGHLKNASALIHQLTQPFNKVATGRPLGRFRIF